MCLSPLKLDISRKKRYFNLGDVLRKEVIVPCGSCSECQMTAHNDLLIRIRSEYDHCVKHGGRVAFVTFTYNEENVPCYTYCMERLGSDEFDKEVQISFTRVSRSDIRNSDSRCNWLYGFDKLQFRNFMKVLRETTARLGYNGSLRYICVSEYGTDSRYTQRPHYHVLFFLDSEVLDLYDSNSIYFLKLCQKYWKYGICSASDKGLFIEGDKCCEYVSKYVAKTSKLLEIRNFKRLLTFITNVHNSGYHFPLDESPMTYFKKVVRSFGISYFVLKSLYFGLAINDEIYNESYDVSTIVDRISHGVDIVKYGETRQYPYPKYNLRKLLYCNRSDGSYYLSPLGISIFKEKAVRSYVSLCRSEVDYFESHSVFLYNTAKSDFDKSALRQYVDNVELLVFYNTFVRGRLFPSDLVPRIEDFLTNFYDYFRDRNYFYSRLSQISRILLDSEIFDDVCELPVDSPTLHDCFLTDDFNLLYGGFGSVSSLQNSEFDFLIDNFRMARCYLGRMNAAKYDQENKDRKMIKDILNRNKYSQY